MHAQALSATSIHNHFESLTLVFSCGGWEKKDFREGGHPAYEQEVAGSSPALPIKPTCWSVIAIALYKTTTL